MKESLSALLLLAFALPAFGQSVTLPAEVKGMRGAWIIVAPSKIDGGIPKWQWDPALQEIDLSALLPPELTKNMRGRVFTSQVDGKFWVRCWNAKGDIASDMATCWLVVGTPGPAPPVPPDPGPIPPGPVPPLPPGPAPLNEPGFRVMIIEDKAKLSLLPKAQLEIRTSPEFRDYLDANCIAEATGTKAYRIWDHKTNATSDLKVWQDAIARPRTSLPWLIVSNPPAAGYEGPLPANVADTLVLLKKVKGN